MPKRNAEVAEAASRANSSESRPPFVGQERVVEYFQRLGANRLAHAYLFSGPRGVGKKTLARTLARTLHCERPSSFPLGYCGTCGPCIRGFAGSSGDTIVVTPEFIRKADALAGKPERKTDDMSMEAARAVIREMQMHSYEGNRLVCILPDFENVTGDIVYNALLKELEEPGENKTFIITVERAESVLPTVRSRATEIRFGPLSQGAIARQLETHHGVEKQRAAALARRAQGSLGDALAELDEDVGALRAAARDWVLACLRTPDEMPPVPPLSKEGRDAARADLDEILRQARIAVRDVAACSLGGEKSILDPEGATQARAMAAALGARAVHIVIAAFDALNDATRLANTNVQPAQILGWLEIRLRSIR